MPLAQNGRGVRGLIWTDSAGVPHTVLLAYLGDRVVWDGHIHETIQVPTMVGYSVAYAPLVGASSEVYGVPAASSMGEMVAPDLVSGGVTIAPGLIAADAVMFEPSLSSGHTIDVGVAETSASLLIPDVRVVFGVTAPQMVATSAFMVPDVSAHAAVAVPVMVAWGEAFTPDVGTLAIVAAPTATATAQCLAPSVSASATVGVPVMDATAFLLAPSVTADSVLGVPLSVASSQFHVPTVEVATFSRQRMNKNGNSTLGAGTVLVPNWTSDATYPATIATNGLQVQGTGAANITGAIVSNSGPTRPNTFSIRLNGTAIWSSQIKTTGTYTIPSIARTLNEGDLIQLYVAGSATAPSVNTGTFIEVVPT
ncbi:hypothetical protein [Gordonia sp. (in: high G+C Gram-positive bacteria)]|uniref:hypothetical protein n=1 Tax=Gordonia sp. (in: high G+C Gram-positive bacteria) TaxID=84139 RepID=UPI003C71F7B5